jgi:hypothetical protein
MGKEMDHEHARLAAHRLEVSPDEHGSLQPGEEDEAGVEARARATEGLRAEKKL